MESLKLIRSLIVLCLLVIIVYACKTQDTIKEEDRTEKLKKISSGDKFTPTVLLSNNTAIKEFATDIRLNRSHWIEFYLQPDFKFNPETFFANNKKIFGLGEHDEMRLISTTGEVKQGISHILAVYNYQQYYKGIELLGITYSVVFYPDSPAKVTGRIIENLDLDLGNIIDEQTAIKMALDTIKAEEYCWENERSIAYHKKEGLEPCRPKVEKFIRFKDKKNRKSFEGKDYELFYAVSIGMIKPINSITMTHIKATSGEIVMFHNGTMHQCHSGTVNSFWNSDQSIDAFRENSTSYKLMDFGCRGDWIIPKSEIDWDNSDACPNLESCVEESSTDSYWDENPSMRRSASALWAVQESWDYFENKFGVHGAEQLKLIMEAQSCGLGTNREINGVVATMKIPENSNTTDAGCTLVNNIPVQTDWINWVNLEVIGHEFTHTIDMFNGNDVGFTTGPGEGGTVIEALCDIFGAIIEINLFGIENYDWLINDQTVFSPYLQRSFSSPNNFGYHKTVLNSTQHNIILGQPDFLGQADMGNSDVFDIYVETGFINHWFYLLAKGGENEVWEDINNNNVRDNDDPSTTYEVNAISIGAIENILFNLFSSSAPNETFIATDGYEIFAQKVLRISDRLFGTNSSEYCSVVSALRAVNLPVSSADIASLQDYYMQVNPDDCGKEPYQGAYPIWVSEDIYVRNGPDGFDNPTHQNPTYDPANPNEVDYVYVKIRNRGCQPITDAKLKVYWSRASTGLMWPEHWRGLNANVNGYFEGGLLAGQEMTDLETTFPFQGPVQIDELLPGEVKTYQIKWVVPNPEEFGDIDLHYCMLARIVSEQDPIEVEAEGLWNYVPKNNNVVWKNVTIMEGIDMMGLVGPGSVWVRKLLADDDKLILRIKSDIPYFLNQGKLYSRITGGGYDKWINASDATSFEELGNFKAEIRKETVDLVFEGLTPGERFTLEIYFKPESDFEQPMKLDVFQIESKQIVGGEQFIIKPTKDMKAKERTFFRESNLDNIVSIFPNPNNGENLKVSINNEKVISEDVLLKIRDLNQQILLEKVVKSNQTSDINIQALKSGVYFLSIEIGERVITKKLVVIKD